MDDITGYPVTHGSLTSGTSLMKAGSSYLAILTSRRRNLSSTLYKSV